MSRYSADSKDRVRDAVDMVALVSAKTELRRSGVNSYFGRCPFHDERTGSFHVSPEEKLYHCFGCGESGDAFDFVMETEGLDFRGALEALAGRFGVTLEVEDEDPAARARRERRERLHALLGRAADYYARYLWESREAAAAREYLARRGLSEATLRTFRVGYAPSAWDRMLLASRQAGFSEEELLATGLAQHSRQRQGSVYDRFRARVMFPLADARGSVVGFGARAMRDDQRPKYLNTSEGEVFHKRSQLFGIDVARRAAARAGQVVLAEGYTDVLALHQAGVEHAVGVMGTSLTEEQARELERTARTLLLALDADRAGQEAMVRAARIAAGRRLELRVVELPEGKDPADLIQEEGAEAVRGRVARSIPFVSFHVDKILGGAELSDAEGKDRALDELRPVLAAVPPSVLREELVGRVARRLGLSAELAGALLAREAAGGGGSGGGGGAGSGAAGQARGGGAPRSGEKPPSGGEPWPGDPGPGYGEDPGPEDADAYYAALAAEAASEGRSGQAGAGAAGRGGAATAEAAGSARLEREFLELCVALPRDGAAALGRVDPERDLTSAIAQRAAAHLAAPGRLDAPADGVPDGDADLAQYLFDIVRRAPQGVPPASLEHARLMLERARLAREIAAARAAGTGGIAALKRRENEVRTELGRLTEQIQSRG